MILSKVANVIHPIILKYAVDSVRAGNLAYELILLYGAVRFLADIIKNLQEVIFANVGASAEVLIADKVYNHVQG